MCQLFEVSKSAYYQWVKRELTQIEKENESLKKRIEKIFQQSRQTYGSRRLKKILEQQGFQVSRRRIARLMKQMG